MDGHVLLLVLAAALLHATWNSIVKGGSNKLFESSINALGGGLGALAILPARTGAGILGPAGTFLLFPPDILHLHLAGL